MKLNISLITLWSHIHNVYSLVREHGRHHVASGHQDGLVAVHHPVLQLETHVVEEGLVLTDPLQLLPEREAVSEAVADVTDVRDLTEILGEALQVEDVGQLSEVEEVREVERDVSRVEISEERLQGRDGHQSPALDDGLETGGGPALLVLLQALLEVDAEEGLVVPELPEDPGSESDQTEAPLPGSHLLALPHQRLRVFPESGSRGQEGLEAGGER